MAITSLDGLIAGMQPGWEFIKTVGPTMVVGRQYSFFYINGMPAAATAPSPGLSGAALTSYAGQLIFPNPATGNAYLARLTAMATVPGHLLLCDRLWHNSGIVITSTGAQTINSVEFPARDDDGTINGKGVRLGIEVSTLTGNNAPVFTATYTNSDDTGSRTGTTFIATTSATVAGSFFPIGLAAGDSGVKSVQTLQMSLSWSSGVIHLVAYRVLAKLDIPVANAPYSIDAITGGLPKAYAGTVPFLIFMPGAVTASTLSGHYVWSHG